MKRFWIITGAILMLPAQYAAAQDSLRTTQLQDVVVTGQFEPQSAKQSVYQVRTVSYAQIVRRGAVDIQTVLATELGVRFESDMALGVSNIKLMGVQGQNVKILLDGIPLLDRGELRESLNQIDINTVERIEIIEGPLSVMYGTDALGGVINIITKKYDDGTWNIEARVLEETAGKEYKPFTGLGVHNQSLSANWMKGKWSAGASVTRNTSGGWNDDHYSSEVLPPPVVWRPKDQWLGMGTVGFSTGKLNLRYRLNYVDETITNLGAYNPLVGEALDKEFITHRYNHQFQAEGYVTKKITFSGVASFQDYSRRTRSLIYYLSTGQSWLSPDASQEESTFKLAMTRGTFLYRLSEKVVLHPGFEVNWTQGMGDRIDREREITDLAAFVSAEIRAASFLAIRPGVRFIHNAVYDAPPVVPSINAKIQLRRDLDLRVAYAYGYRSPALRELYFSFHDASHDIYGNENLKAEYSNSYTASLSWQAYTTGDTQFSMVAGGFLNTFKDQIILASVADPSAPSGTISTYANLTDSRTAGGTLDNNFRYKALQASLGFSYIGVADPLKAAEGEIDLAWSPEIRANIAYTWSKIGTTISLFYKFNGKLQQYEYDTATGEAEPELRLAEVESFHMADLTAGKKINRFLDLTAGVRNLFDVTTLNNTSLGGGDPHAGSTGSVPTAYGRSYFVSLQFHMTK